MKSLTDQPWPNHALQRTAPAVTARASTATFPPAMHGPRQPPPSLSLGSLGVTPPLVCNHALFGVYRELMTYPETHGLVSLSPVSSASPSLPFSAVSPGSTCRRFWSALDFMRSADARFCPVVVWALSPNNVTPNHALQRTAALAFSLRRAAVHFTGSVTACAPAMKPGTARACASRRRAHTGAPRLRSLSLGSLGDLARLP